MKIFSAIMLCLLCVQASYAQLSRPVDTDIARTLASTITPVELERHLTQIASEEFEGRETGSPGQRKAAEYIASVFSSYGLPPAVGDSSYFQRISFIAETWAEINMMVGDESIRHLWEYYSVPGQNASRESFSTREVVFLGYGIDDPRYSDYAEQDVNGKTILIYAGEPLNTDGNSLLTNDTSRTAWTSDPTLKLRAAHKHGAAMVMIIDPDFRRNVDQVRREILNNRLRMGWSANPADNFANSVYLSSEAARKILGKSFNDVVNARTRIERTAKPRAVTFPAKLSFVQRKNVRELLGENVLGFVEGSDPVLKNEVLVVTAHYDHLGRRGDGIYFGADDNGSGTSTVLEIAQAFAEARKLGYGPRRSVLFLLVSGEEKGLLGSEYYVNYPVFPLENTIANINIDMVGRIDPQHEQNPDYIYVIGSDRLSSELHTINEEANTTYTQLELDYTYNAENDPNRYYYRSDHYNFAERGIPAIFYFNGTHADYHRTTDTVDKIQFEKMATIGKLVFHTAWELSNRDKRIVVDKVSK
jgi:hypothetical protein